MGSGKHSSVCTEVARQHNFWSLISQGLREIKNIKNHIVEWQMSPIHLLPNRVWFCNFSKFVDVPTPFLYERDRSQASGLSDVTRGQGMTSRSIPRFYDVDNIGSQSNVTVLYCMAPSSRLTGHPVE